MTRIGTMTGLAMFQKKDGRFYIAEPFSDMDEKTWESVCREYGNVHSYYDFIKSNVAAQARARDFDSLGSWGAIVKSVRKNLVDVDGNVHMHGIPAADVKIVISETERNEEPCIQINR